MAVYKIHMHNPMARQDIELEQHANSEEEARQSATFKFPAYRIVTLKKIETPGHDRNVKIAESLLKMARQSKDPRVKTIGLLSAPVAAIAVDIKDAVERRIRAGETSFDDIARAIFENILRS